MEYCCISRKQIQKAKEKKEKIMQKKLIESDLFALDVHMVRILQEAKTAKNEKDWKTFGFKMYKAGECASKIRSMERDFNIKNNTKRIEGLLNYDSKNEIPGFISKETIEEFSEVL